VSVNDFRLIDLKQAILAAVRVQPGIRLVILFGSLAVGEGGLESDLDLAVDAGRPLTAGDKMTLISELGRRTGRPVDLVDIHAVGEPETRKPRFYAQGTWSF